MANPVGNYQNVPFRYEDAVDPEIQQPNQPEGLCRRLRRAVKTLCAVVARTLHL